MKCSIPERLLVLFAFYFFYQHTSSEVSFPGDGGVEFGLLGEVVGDGDADEDGMSVSISSIVSNGIDGE